MECTQGDGGEGGDDGDDEDEDDDDDAVQLAILERHTLNPLHGDVCRRRIGGGAFGCPVGCV